MPGKTPCPSNLRDFWVLILTTRGKTTIWIRQTGLRGHSIHPLAHRMLQLVLASLLHCFDWELGSNSALETIDMNERLGITVRKLVPSKAIPKKKVMQEG